MIPQSLAEQTKAMRRIIWVYVGLLVSAFIILPIQIFIPDAQRPWFYVSFVLAACLIGVILGPGLFSPHVYMRRHTQQALVLDGLFMLCVLMSHESWAVMLGEEITPACCTALPFGLFLLLWGSIAGIRQVRRSDCLLMELAGAGKALPRPRAMSESVASASISVALPAGDENARDQRTTVGWGFYGQWILANAFGWAWTWGAGILLGLPAFLGARLLRMGQTRLLRTQLGEDATRDFTKTSWLGASLATVGTVIMVFLLLFSDFSFVVDRIPQPDEEKLAMYNSIMALSLASVIGVLGGFFTGMAQWRSVFRERSSQSGLWVVANSLGWGLGWLGGTLVILKALGSDMPNGVVMVIGSVAGLGVLAGLLVGAVTGAVTGLALIRMFKHPLPPAPGEQAAPDPSRTMT